MDTSNGFRPCKLQLIHHGMESRHCTGEYFLRVFIKFCPVRIRHKLQFFKQDFGKKALLGKKQNFGFIALQDHRW